MAKKAIELWGSGSYRAEGVTEKPHETSVLKLSSEKAANVLGWKRSYAWEEAVASTVAWFKEYQKQATAGQNAAVDMYDFCVQQIDQYTERARKLGRCWTLA